jgi:hypothetical protein
MRSLPAVALVVGLASGAAFAGGPPKDQSECLERSRALEAEAERRHKATKLQIPREFARVSSNLDDFCNDNDFVKAAVSIAWMETCLSHFAKPYELGFCTRNRAYFCATFPESDGCRGGR